MERLSVDNLSLGMGILARKSLTTSGSRKASQISLLNDSFAEHYHQIDDRNWSWTHLRVIDHLHLLIFYLHASFTVIHQFISIHIYDTNQ